MEQQVATLDPQPSSEQGGIQVMVTDALLVDKEQNLMGFPQMFQLLPDGQKSFFVFNDTSRLICSAL